MERHSDGGNVFEVELVSNAGKLQTHYSNTFESLFKQKPHIAEHEQPIFRWAVNQFGLHKAMQMIDAYFALDDDWIRDHSYPISQFKRQINRVIALPATTKSITTAPSLKMNAQIYCDACGKRSFVIVPMNYDFSKKTLCEECDVYK